MIKVLYIHINIRRCTYSSVTDQELLCFQKSVLAALYSSEGSVMEVRIDYLSTIYPSPPPFEEGMTYCVAHIHRYVSLPNIVQLIKKQRAVSETSNLLGR